MLFLPVLSGRDSSSTQWWLFLATIPMHPTPTKGWDAPVSHNNPNSACRWDALTHSSWEKSFFPLGKNT